MTRVAIRSSSALLALGIVLFIATPAAGVDRSTEDFIDVARSARVDAAAVSDLTATTSIDGIPVDVAAIFNDPETRAGRLDALLAPGGAGHEPRTAALIHPILAEQRFDTTRNVSAATVVRAWTLRLVQGILSALERAIPGGLATLGWVLLVATVAGSGIVAVSLLRRREREVEGATRSDMGAERVRPATLERQAAAAERDGDLEEALRLRFHAALLRLDAHGAIRFHDGLTSGHVLDGVPHRLVPPLVAAHDEVVYGGRAPTLDDLAESRMGWPRVISEVTP